MPYNPPTLFGVAYASRLFREIDALSTFQHLLEEAAPVIDLQSPIHTDAVLRWLNKWGCRIAKTRFSVLTQELSKWFRARMPNLPPLEAELVNLGPAELDEIADAYGALLNIPLGPTPAAKIMFALRPASAIPWDKQMRTEFNLLAGDVPSYREMLQRSKDEIGGLIADCRRRDVHNWHDIPNREPGPGRTLVRLLDEYHWITITRGHQIPSCEDLTQWVLWACPRNQQGSRRTRA